MNWLDAVILVVLIIPTFVGFRRGFWRTVIPLAAVSSGVVLAGVFHGSVSAWFEPWLSSSQASFAAFASILIVYFVAGLLLVRLSRRIFGVVTLGWGGLTRTVVPGIGILTGLALAGLFYDDVAAWLGGWLDDKGQARIAGFLIIFIFAVVMSAELFLVLSSLPRKRPPAIPFGWWIDKLAGVITGLAVGAVICSAVLSLVVKYDFPQMSHSVAGSTFATLFLDNFPFILHLLPDDFEAVRLFFN